MIYNASQILTKVSFLIQYRRLFPSDKLQRICFWLLLFIVGWGLTQEYVTHYLRYTLANGNGRFIVGFSCTPLTAFVPGMVGKCIYTLPVWYLTSCMNIVTDFMIFAIPIVPVIKLRIGNKQKGLLLALFCLGFLYVHESIRVALFIRLTCFSTCIISLIRLSTLHKGINTKDPFWDNAPAAYWSVVELNCGILCACLPTLRPLIQRMVPRIFSTYRSSGRGSNGRQSSGYSHRLSSLRKKESRDPEDGIYIRKEVELHSTTELREHVADMENRPSVEISHPQEAHVVGLSKS
jgi:hypothetical protein